MSVHQTVMAARYEGTVAISTNGNINRPFYGAKTVGWKVYFTPHVR